MQSLEARYADASTKCSQALLAIDETDPAGRMKYRSVLAWWLNLFADMGMHEDPMWSHVYLFFSEQLTHEN
jgi:hypothetical protein